MTEANRATETDVACSRCEGRGEIEPAWPVGPSGASLSSYTCSVCNGTGIKPKSRPVMNSPADEAEARDRANTAPRSAEHDAACRGETGASSCPEARPVTATEQLSSKQMVDNADVLWQEVNRQLRAEVGVPSITLNAAHWRAAIEEVERLREERRRIVDATDRLKADTKGGCSICGALPVVNVEGTFWLCGPCVSERVYPNAYDAGWKDRGELTAVETAACQVCGDPLPPLAEWSTPVCPPCTAIADAGKCAWCKQPLPEKTEERRLSGSEERSFTETFRRSPRRIDSNTGARVDNPPEPPDADPIF